MISEMEYYNWQKFYDQLKGDIQSKRKISSQIVPQDKKGYANRVAALEKVLNIMKDAPMEYEITISEIARRFVIIENLKKQIATDSFGSNGTVGSGGELSSVVTNTNTNTNNNNNNNNASTVVVNPMGFTDKALQQRQKEVLQTQDHMLGDIEKGLDRLHGQAKEINVESKAHNAILEEMEGHIDDTTDRLKEETKHAQQIKKATSNFYLYVCVAIELIVLVVIIAIVFMSKK